MVKVQATEGHYFTQKENVPIKDRIITKEVIAKDENVIENIFVEITEGEATEYKKLKEEYEQQLEQELNESLK